MSTSHRLRRWLLVAAAAAIGVAAVVAAVPPLRARAVAVAVVARSIGVPFPRPLAARVSVRTNLTLGPGLQGDLYWPGGPAPIVVLATGGNAQGKDDPRVVRVARSLAGAHRVVFVPQLDLRRQTLEEADVERIVHSVSVLRGALPGFTVGLVGFSFGGSFCLLAAEDPAIGPLAFVAVFGAYDRLLDLIQGVTTGATTLDGRAVRWQPSAEGLGILRHAAIQLASPQDRGPLTSALQSTDPAGLSPAARAVYDLLENTDPFRTPRLAEALPASFRDTLARFSPATHLSRLRAPLFIMHSVHDPAAPPAEATLLHRSVPRSRLIVLHYFEHVSPPGQGTPIGGYLADGWGAVQFMAWILQAQG